MNGFCVYFKECWAVSMDCIWPWKKITVSVVKISGWQSFQSLHSTLNAMPLGNLKIFVRLCTLKAEQLGSMLEYHETKTCH